MSLIESATSVVLGFIITILIQYLIYPLFGIEVPASEAFFISIIIVFSAFVKNFIVRRVFNSLKN